MEVDGRIGCFQPLVDRRFHLIGPNETEQGVCIFHMLVSSPKPNVGGLDTEEAQCPSQPVRDVVHIVLQPLQRAFAKRVRHASKCRRPNFLLPELGEFVTELGDALSAGADNSLDVLRKLGLVSERLASEALAELTEAAQEGECLVESVVDVGVLNSNGVVVVENPLGDLDAKRQSVDRYGERVDHRRVKR